MSFRISEAGQRSQPLFAVLFVLLTFTQSGCVTLDLPQEFLVVEKTTDEFKAVTAGDAMVWVRTFHEDGGALSFWREAITNDFVDHRGYVLVEEQEVKNSEGNEGVELLFELTAHGAPRRYLIAIFVSETWPSGTQIRTVEYTADKTLFEKHLKEVREAIAKM